MGLLKHLFFIAGIVLGLAVTVAAQTKPVPENPFLKFQGLDGKTYDLSEQRGNVVLVSFGATWCTPCVTELRALGEVLHEYRDKPVKFFWVSIERPEEVSSSALKQYAKERRLPFPVLRDSAKMVFLQFTDRVRLPMILMLGKDGKVDVPVKFGLESQIETYKADIRARLNRLLGGRDSAGQ